MITRTQKNKNENKNQIFQMTIRKKRTKKMMDKTKWNKINAENNYTRRTFLGPTMLADNSPLTPGGTIQ
uniref:Uncharacterized protein n=1 Tax=Rhizophora mucronata TaxID=61149 RepID=A0A2P2PJC4_RHIMU